MGSDWHLRLAMGKLQADIAGHICCKDPGRPYAANRGCGRTEWVSLLGPPPRAERARNASELGLATISGPAQAKLQSEELFPLPKPGA